jgi:hypothetical protein
VSNKNSNNENSNSKTNATPQEPPFSSSPQLQKPKTLRRVALLLCIGTLSLLVSLLTGCATPQTRPCETLPLPTAPALSEPLPSASHSSQWSELALSLQKKLTATPMTQLPATTPGPNQIRGPDQ